MKKDKIPNDTKNHIDSRTSEDVERSRENLLQVSTYIKQLNTYIDGGDIKLSKHKIYNMIQWLFKNFTLNLIYQLDKDIVVFRRARKYEETNIEHKGDRLLLINQWLYYSINRQAPLGNEKWQVETATKFGMLSTPNQRGRPRKDV